MRSGCAWSADVSVVRSKPCFLQGKRYIFVLVLLEVSVAIFEKSLFSVVKTMFSELNLWSPAGGYFGGALRNRVFYKESGIFSFLFCSKLVLRFLKNLCFPL